MTTPVVVTDSFTGSDAAPWNSTTWPVMRDCFATVPPSPGGTIHTNQGRMDTEAGDRWVVAFTVPDMVNFQLELTFQRPGTDPSYPMVGYRVGTNVDSGRPGQGGAGYAIWLWHTPGQVYLQDLGIQDGITAVTAPEINDTAPHHLKLLVREDRHRAKWWAVGDDEPPGYQLDWTDDSYGAAGRIFVGMTNDGVNAGRAVFDSFTLTEILPADPGINLGGSIDEIVGLYVGAEPVVAAYIGTTPVVVP